MANGINSAGTVVGGDGTNQAFFLGQGGEVNFIPNNGTSAMAFGINDHGVIVGQYTTTGTPIPGFALNGQTVTTINAPSGPDQVNAQGINNNGLVVGFYVGTDGNDHGFKFNLSSAVNNVGTGTAILIRQSPQIRTSPAPPSSFPRSLGSTTRASRWVITAIPPPASTGLSTIPTRERNLSRRPSAQFDNGVEVTQITGINNADEITGFYTDSNGLAHGFVATLSVPEPSSVALLGIVLIAALGYSHRSRKRAAR